MGLSRAEEILRSKIEGTLYTKKPLSRIEEDLLQLNTGGGGTPSGPVSDETYNDIMDKLEDRNELTSEELRRMWEDE